MRSTCNGLQQRSQIFKLCILNRCIFNILLKKWIYLVLTEHENIRCLDVGTSINTFNILWKCLQHISNVINHCWDFHITKKKQACLCGNSHRRCCKNSQENTCARGSFLIKLQVFSCEFYEIFNNTFFTEHFGTTASICVHQIIYLGSWLKATTAIEPGELSKEWLKCLRDSSLKDF